MSAPIRLVRETPAAGQAGCATTIGVFLIALGLIIGLGMRSDAPRPATNEWLVYVVGGGFSLVGLIVVILGIKMFLATRVPETIVEVDKTPLSAGDTFQVTARQPGPVRLTSLRVNLVGEQLTRREVWRDGKRRIDTDRRIIHQANVLDLRDISIQHGEEVVRRGTAMVPADVRLADIEGEKQVVWRLEVWGQVRGWVDFGHPFVMDVVGDANPSPTVPDS
jgi:hypothetical protein